MINDDKKLINILKKFPDQNPNPVLRISEKGMLEYFNRPSKIIIDHYDFKLKNKVNDIFLAELKETLSKNEHTFEIKLESSSFLLKAIYLKELNSFNIYGTDITAKKVIDKFPDSNPNPVMRISYDGILNYYNKGSQYLVTELELKLGHTVPKLILKYVGEVSLSGEAAFYEVFVGKNTYSASFVPIPEFNFIIMYATDITALKVINKFPNQNPNPVLRIDLDGKLNYFNNASKYIIEKWSIGLDSKVPEIIFERVVNNEKVFEIEVGSKFYSFNIVKINEFNFYLFYGTDITDSKDKENILNKLSKYFSPQVYNSIFSGELDVAINTSRKDLTVFFSDIKSFTTITERLEPEILTKLITNYLTEMTNIAIEYGGTVDKYIGDAIMIFFGDPNSKGIKKDAIACVSMALKMKKVLNKLRKNWRSAGLSESLDVRMGIHTDMCTVGNFGSIDRLDYTVLGNGVNLASRLESLSNSNEILISENTYNLIKEEINCKYFDEIKVKGKAHSIKTFQVIDKKTEGKKKVIIEASKEGFNLTIDKKKIKNKDEIISLLEESIDKLTG